MNSNKVKLGHLSAVITILIWGTTFISTKVLLKDFTPIEILVFRFAIGYITLLFIYPHHVKKVELKQELYFVIAGLSGVTLYFLLENISLIYTLATNVGVIISIAPFFTAIFAHLFLDNEKLTLRFFIGLMVAIIGILLIEFNGKFVLKLNPFGDILAILAAILWAVYSVIMKKISSFQYNTIISTRKVFFYGLIFMIPAIFIFDFKFQLYRFTSALNLMNILYLGFGASALCFVTWNWSVKVLGVVKTSVYIYMVPVITAGSSVVILHENITAISIIGIALTLTGLFISDGKQIIKLRREMNDERTRYKMRYSDK
ncbi:DMT family transporter [Clostridium saccharobutylicum]|uniref:Transporter YbhF n=1 Tax=Clostridium saccharobutylicum DSM 13864 TaxID=1345695 RepID=U5MQF0_CLOSA|nr:DMT family transporter [Clostridium saccharobutylicum]AGX43014.1 transporter YbhF [Clostridium saccharobutylicum DSM 13864]AQR90306.1 putative amino-acid metabolite efflux pump [Clostridium saccharobutylicum]AQS00212.1 putative amino-acid metabolite efflux pump [Clostridium saccharobutylicum]AQS10011.1 putative amino-acid metabolite efflux pump [Clostridium saccharobutylicum]AQS14195.1 putative amino-acid metabolite efflux pump [Clostridium saccharobutylicum]